MSAAGPAISTASVAGWIGSARECALPGRHGLLITERVSE
jgi:hypothetical protein